jgi:FKBP-type peptidyl-prolyl cis-trans isomerase FklB
MRNIKVILLTLLFIPSVLFAQKSKVSFKNDLDSVSYCMGAVIGNSLKMAGFVSFNSKLFLQAINEVLTEKTTAFKSNQNDSIIRNYFMKLQSKKAAENLITGKKFLEQNKKKDSIVALPSGLQYKIITQGQGESPLITDKVTVNYEGKLLNGKVFDSSKQKGQPVEFGVNGVIKGWTEALQLMKKGSKWILYIPPDLAYGEQNIQGIEPNSVLIFEVELLSIEKENNQNIPNQ